MCQEMIIDDRTVSQADILRKCVPLPETLFFMGKKGNPLARLAFVLAAFDPEDKDKFLFDLALNNFFATVTNYQYWKTLQPIRDSKSTQSAPAESAVPA